MLPVVMGYALVFTMAAAGLAEYATGTSRQIAAGKNQLRTFYAGEAAIAKAKSAIDLFVANNGAVPVGANLTAIQNSVVHFTSGFTADDTMGNNTLTLADSGGWTTQVLTLGNYAGLNGATRTLTINVSARNTEGFANVEPVAMQQLLQVQLIPIFQFGVFYEKDLEILPGGSMNFIGPVHSNQNIYLGADGSTLSFDSTMTAYGNIYHGRKDSTNPVSGNVWIEDSNDVSQNMLSPDSTWLDSNSANWLTESQTRWGGTVRSAAHNTNNLSLPLPTGANAHTLVERRSAGDSADVQAQKMDYKAQIRIVDGQVMSQNGAALDLRYCTAGAPIDTKGTLSQADDRCPGNIVPFNPISKRTFTNLRENKTIQSTDIDVTMLNTSPTFQAIANASPGVIIYHSDHTNQGSAVNQDALRLTNGATLYKDMTVVSENPVYVKGSYNSSTNPAIKKAAGIISDAFNVLSASWNDANSALAIANRTASNTTIQAAVIAGNKETVTGNYNGGFENIHRLLENWSGKTLTYKGSVIVLYNSQYATGNWVYGAPYYTAPTRNWSFDTDMSDPNYHVPGFPSVYQVVEQRWSVT